MDGWNEDFEVAKGHVEEDEISDDGREVRGEGVGDYGFGQLTMEMFQS